MEEPQNEGEIVIVSEPITKDEARAIGNPWYEDMVKGVVDIEKGIVALGGEYHMDANVVLVANGSAQDKVWGFNIYPDKKEDWIAFVSLINIRPALGNTTMEMKNEETREAMRTIIERLIV